MEPLRRIGSLLGVTLMAAGLSMTGMPSAAADVEKELGYATKPAQPYRDNPDDSDWVGSYTVDGKQVWCVQFAYRAPDSEEKYEPGDELQTKWGTDLPADQAADISYLLLRHGKTKEKDEAAALGHLLHSWTSAPRDDSDLDPENDYKDIAYDAPYHLEKLPDSAQSKVDELKKEAEANRGPWQAEVSAPEGEQTIGEADDWTIDVRNAADKGVGDVPVEITATDAELTDADGAKTDTLKTPADGSPLTVSVTPTGPKPALAIKLDSPAAKPIVRDPVESDSQRIVATGGENELAVTDETTAEAAPATTTPAPSTTAETTTEQVPSVIPAGDEPSAAGGVPTGVIVGGAVGAGVLLGAALIGRRPRGEHLR